MPFVGVHALTHILRLFERLSGAVILDIVSDLVITPQELQCLNLLSLNLREVFLGHLAEMVIADKYLVFGF